MIKLINREEKRQTFHVNEFQVINVGCSYFVLMEGKHNFSLLRCGGYTQWHFPQCTVWKWEVERNNCVVEKVHKPYLSEVNESNINLVDSIHSWYGVMKMEVYLCALPLVCPWEKHLTTLSLMTYKIPDKDSWKLSRTFSKQGKSETFP